MIQKDIRRIFHPGFGSRPSEIVGRDSILNDFTEGLREPVGSRERCRFYTGQRGMGKTALLLELADIAEEMGFITARVTAYEGLNEDVIETLQRNGARFVTENKPKVKGASAGALGYGFRAKLTMLCDELKKYGKGVLILVDEVRTSTPMRELAITYQHLVGEDKNIAIVMAGLPHAVSTVLNDEVLTFLNRAAKTKLEPIRTKEILAYYRDAFHKLDVSISEELLQQAAEAAMGFPYLMQLIGYNIAHDKRIKGSVSKKIVEEAIISAKEDMADTVFSPILSPLSDNDLVFLRAMAEDESISKISDICTRTGRTNSYIQPYRARLIDAGIIESPRKGELVFAVPYLAEYLRSL